MDERKNFRIGVYCAEILICYVLSGVPGLLPEIFSSLPTLAISCCITIALFESQKTAIIIGAVCGALIDISSSTVIGPMGILLTLICFLISFLADEFFSNNVLFDLLALFLSCLISISAIYLINNLSYGINLSFIDYFNFCVGKFIYTFICTVILYFLNKDISKIKSTV